MERKGPELHDRVAREPASTPDVRSRLGDAQLRIAALARRPPDDVPPSTPQSVPTADQLSALAEELSVAQEQLRRQTSELELARQLLEAERERFRGLFEVAPEGHIITDSSGAVRELNRGAAALLNLPGDYIIGKPLAVFIDPNDRREFRVRTYRARTKLAEEGWTLTLLPRDSAPLRAYIAVSPLLDSHGTLTALRWLVRDVSNQRAGAVLDRTPGAVLRSALDALSTQVAVIEADGAIVTTNRAWRDATRPGGVFDRAGAGVNYLQLCDAAIQSGHHGADVIRAAVLRVLDGRDDADEALYCAAPKSTSVDADDELWFSVRVRRCDGPQPAMVVVTHEDVTAQRRAQARETALITERSARAAAEAASRAKSEFLATLSHELRTPLNAIAGYAQLLEMGVRGPVTQQQTEDLRRILRSEQHLLGLINELLSFSRVERGEVKIDVAPVSILDATHEVIELIEPQAIQKGLDIAVHCDDRDLRAMADADRLRQILLNLLSNAVKFTPEGGGIHVSCAGVDGRVTVCVHDTGIGIPHAKQEEVFDPFVQVDRGAGSHSEGIGLGLAISRSLARAMNGDVTVRSEPGKGSTFELTLPRAGRDPALS